MANNFLEDTKGNKSSKRLWGSALLSMGVLFSAVLFICSLISGAEDPSTAFEIINSFLITGGSLLGIGIFENLKITARR